VIQTRKDKLKSALDEALLAMLGSQEFVERWWVSPNLSFGMKQPSAVFDTDPAAVQKYILTFLQR
jgi:hypothetical protein